MKQRDTTTTATEPVGPPAGRGAAARAVRIAAAKAEREQKARAAKRRNLLITIGAVVAVFAVVIAFVVVRSSKRSVTASPPPTGLTSYQGVSGSLYGSVKAPVTITLFEDFQCSACEALEKADGAAFTAVADQGRARILYTPVAILDAYSNGNHYSSRAASAFYCTPSADRKKLHDAFYANQPPENAHGQTDAQLLATATKVGISSSSFSSCLKAQKYTEYALGTQTDKMASFDGASVATPTMLVNGKVYAGVTSLTPAVLEQIVAQAASS